jgi:tetraacyldisaccharide 4'-kinase
MKLSKPKFWDTKISFYSIFLFPISLGVSLFIFLKKKIIKPIKFNIPIICVGNIYIGGTGKTPTSILLATTLAKIGKKPMILRKYYKSHVDEHNLIKNEFKHLVLCRKRIDGIKEVNKSKYDCVILDDGFQDYKIKKDLSILCFNQRQLIGNGLILPAGPLRESLNSINSADIVLINGKKDEDFEKKILNINTNLKIYYAQYKPINIEQFKNKDLFAIAAIGNPDNFFELIKKNKLNIKRKLVFPDHYEFSKNELQDIIEIAKQKNYQIITTEKDYFKVKHFNFKEIKCLKVSLEINDKHQLIKSITKLYDKNN